VQAESLALGQYLSTPSQKIIIKVMRKCLVPKMQGYLKNTLSRTKRRFNQSQLGLEPEGKDFREILGERGGGTNSTAVLGSGLTAKSAIRKELKEDMISKWTERWQSSVDY
jgi:hypothetical protein